PQNNGGFDVRNFRKSAFNFRGGDVLAILQHQNVVEPVGDVEIAVLIDPADVARVIPAVGPGGGCFGGAVPIAGRQVRPADEQLPCVGVYLGFHPDKRQADASQARVGRDIGGDG